MKSGITIVHRLRRGGAPLLLGVALLVALVNPLQWMVARRTVTR